MKMLKQIARHFCWALLALLFYAGLLAIVGRVWPSHWWQQ